LDDGTPWSLKKTKKVKNTEIGRRLFTKITNGMGRKKRRMA